MGGFNFGTESSSDSDAEERKKKKSDTEEEGEGSGDQTVLDIQADVTDYDSILGIAKASGNVIVKYGTVTIEAGQVEYHRSSGKIFARDDVRIFKEGEVIEAEEIIYDTKTEELVTSQLRSALEPVFYTSDNVQRPEADTDGPITLLDSTFTTHDSATPNYHFKVKKLEVYPDKKLLVMHGAKVYVGRTPVFWFPYYVQPLDSELGYYPTPGWNSAWGGFLLNRYGFMVGENILAKAHLDYRSKRGLAGGFEFESKKFEHNPNIGRLNLYYANDSNPQIGFSGRNRAKGTTSDRYRINFQHRVYFPGSDDETFYLDFDINKLSDQFFYQDFSPAEFRIDPRPDNVINLVKLFDQGEVSLTGRFQLNEFFRTDTRSPELAIDIIRTPIADTGFFYDSMTTYGILDEELDDDAILDGMIDPSGYDRFRTYHEFLFPTQLGFLNVVPRGGAGYAHYTDFDIPGLNTFESTTTHAGVDLSFKMSKRSPDIMNEALGVDGLLHIVRPYVNFSLVNTNEINGRFTPIDRLTPTTRLRPIDLPLFTSVDDLRDWQIVRGGVSNRWLTKRNGQSHEWLSLDNYIEYYAKDPEFARDFSNFFTEVNWSPLPWLSAGTTAQIPIFDEVLDFSEVNSRINFMPTDWFRFGVGHYYLNNHPFFRDSDLYSLSTYTRLSDNWGFSTAHRFESDDSTLEYQQYTIHRDLASWTAGLGGIIRDNRQAEKEYGVILSLTLKAFPKATIPVDFQPGSLGAE